MNIDDSVARSSCAVKSKYFTEGAAMDDSLSDFQEPKNVNTGPKKTTNPKISKPKKALKRPRGQKDIRTVLKSTKKELESYSKAFDKVCKKAGIDVDSEELQLAIALSKSLQNTPSSSNDTGECSQISTTQGRIGKIRTTLQEYGFKVPEVKIAGNTRKLPRKHRKHYKLIHTSNTEKNQIIADKYSQILFQDISHCNLYYSDVDTSNIRIYFLASNVSYDVLKQAEIFYIRDSLIEHRSHNGNLLKDWSTIPGRPESPKLFEPMSINFSEIECSQDELDVVLSGTIKKCRDLVTKKIKDWEDKVGIEDNVKKDTDVNKDQIQCNTSSENLKEYINNLVIDKKKSRSCSPDMFDEDASDLFESSINQTLEKSRQSVYVMQKYESRKGEEVMDLTEIVDEKSKQNSNTTKRKSNDLKKITECITSSTCTVNETLSQLSHKSNVTKRKSNDIMELTKCVGNSSPLQNNIDLTQNSDILEINITNKPKEKVNATTICKNIDEDLTKGPKINSHNTEASSTHEHTLNENSANKDTESMDLTQSSNTSDELPFISLTGKNDKFLDETIIVDVNTHADTNKRIILQTDAEVHIDLTQCAQNDIETCNSNHSKSFFEEFNHDHSESTGEEISCKLSEENPSEVILTQSSRQRIRSENSVGRKNIFTSIFQCSKEASQINEETISFEKNPSTSYRYPKPGKVDLTIIDENCFIVSEHRPKIRGKSTSTSLLEDYSDDDDLTKKSDTSEELKETSKVSHYEDRLNSVLQNHVVDIDLTQKSDTSEELSQSCNDRSKYGYENYRSKITSPNKSEQHDQHNSNDDVTEDSNLKSGRSCSSLEKKNDNMSIDYDEFISTDTNLNIEKELVAQEKTNNKEKNSRQSSMLSNCSQNSESEVFDLTDQELNYSLHQSKLEVPKDNFEFGGISIMDDLSNLGTKKSLETVHNTTAKHDDLIESIPKIPELNTNMISRCNEISPIKHRRITEIATPQKSSGSNMITVTTPKNSEFIIKTNNVTPMKDYESMSTSEIYHELDKYGIKPFKRKRAIQLLTHIYNQTHPNIENTNELASPPKRHKPNNYLAWSPNKLKSPRKCTGIGISDSPNNFQDKEKENNGNEKCLNQRSSPRNLITKGKGKGKGKRSSENRKEHVEEIKIISEIQNPLNNKEILDEGELRSSQRSKKNEHGLISNEIECNPEDWVFQKREKAQVHSCRVPLHIAFYNYVSLRRDLREAILCYEPVEIDRIHKDLVSYGHRYDPKDLLKFLDKKCITVKTTDNDAKNQKR